METQIYISVYVDTNATITLFNTNWQLESYVGMLNCMYRNQKPFEKSLYFDITEYVFMCYIYMYKYIHKTVYICIYVDMNVRHISSVYTI